MNRANRGMTLMHLMIYMAILPVVLEIGTALYFKTMDLFTKTETILDDLSNGQDLLENLKRDLRAAKSVEIQEEGLSIEFAQLKGGKVHYCFNREKGSVDRSGVNGSRTYRSFSSFMARRDGKRLVDVVITLKKSNEQSVFNPVWSTTVFCANLEAEHE